MTDQDVLDVLIGQVRDYLAGEFSDVRIVDTARMIRDDGIDVHIQADGEEYRLRILDEVVEQQGAENIGAFLAENNAATVMRELIGFPVMITANGCVFDDV